MEEHYTSYIESPIGPLKIETNREHLLSLSFVAEMGTDSSELPVVMQNSVTQLQEYFAGNRRQFDLPLFPAGTEFQQKVWRLVSEIPFGRTASYLDIALQLGSAKNTRAVGLSNGKNPIPIIIPCHRIVGSNGNLTGYAGGLDRKRWLLLHELQFSEKKTLF